MKIITLIGMFLASNVFAQSGDLNGQIINKQKQFVTGTTIRIHNTDRHTTSDQSGQFSFEDLAYGRYELDIEISKRQHYNTQINHTGEPVILNIDNLNLDDMVVSANPLEHNQLRMTTPVAILSEEELVMDRGLSIDQTINHIPGVNSGSFGAGAGQVVIRGQQGPRVTILNNNIANQDASSVSPDHWISTEPLLAKQIEVLKGPATLLYGGGAVGGVVNVLDDVIASQAIEGITGGFEGRLSDSALGERAGVFSLNAGLSERLMSHISYFNSQTDDYEIPGAAESAILHNFEGHEEEQEDGSGVLENSSVESDGFNLGFSLITDNGYWGASFSDFNRNYGIPGHEHEEGEHEEGEHEEGEHEEGEHEEGEHEEGEHEEEAEIVRIDLDKSVINLKGRHQFANNRYISQLKTHYSKTDYQHVEFEGAEIGTLFDNQADEFRLELTHGVVGGFEGVLGFQYSNRDFSAIGEEAFILPTETAIFSLFLIEERGFENWHAEFGLRYDNQTVSTDLYNDLDDSAVSMSLGATFDINDQWTVPINVTSAQRLPTAEEYFSNQSGQSELIPHLATATIEIGNLDLQHETANNFDIGLKYRNQGLRFNLALFYNQIDDFIFLRDTGVSIEDIPVFVYTQQNTTFTGFETDIGYQFEDGFNNQWDVSLFADSTTAELNSGENVPRIPSDRIGLGINWIRGSWSVSIDHTHVSKQNDLADYELPTAGYDLLDLTANWIHYGTRTETLVFLKANNMLDEDIRDHSSFIKDIAPNPGRSISAGFRLSF